MSQVVKKVKRSNDFARSCWRVRIGLVTEKNYRALSTHCLTTGGRIFRGISFLSTIFVVSGISGFSGLKL